MAGQRRHVGHWLASGLTDRASGPRVIDESVKETKKA